LLLDGEQELGYPLDLVDHHGLGGVDKSGRIGDRRLSGRGGIQIPWCVGRSIRDTLVAGLVVRWS
jgi:hypothetical protein